MDILIDNRTDEGFFEEYEEIIKEAVTKSCSHLGRSLDVEVSVSIVSNEEIRQLNSQYRGIDKETDVLSFPLDDEMYLGDIVISMEKVREQAESLAQSVERELCFLTVHSMLHLYGYDHMEPEEEEAMIEMQKHIMQIVDLGGK